MSNITFLTAKRDIFFVARSRETGSTQIFRIARDNLSGKVGAHIVGREAVTASFA